MSRSYYDSSSFHLTHKVKHFGNISFPVKDVNDTCLLTDKRGCFFKLLLGGLRGLFQFLELLFYRFEGFNPSIGLFLFKRSVPVCFALGCSTDFFLLGIRS